MRRGIDSFQLKCIAILSMAADHTGALLFPEQMWLRGVGRLAFPIFAFVLAEGFFYTHDIKRYLARMGVFALLSEIPYDLAFQGAVLEFDRQNVFFTLTVSLLVLCVMEKVTGQILKAVVVLFGMWLCEWIHTDYGMMGVLLPAIYAAFRDRFQVKIALGAFWNLLWTPGVQYLGSLASIPIAFYNGEWGRSMKYLFYLFYPGHLLVLHGIQSYFFHI